MILMGLKTSIDHGERLSDADTRHDLLFNGPQVCSDFICTTPYLLHQIPPNPYESDV